MFEDLEMKLELSADFLVQVCYKVNPMILDNEMVDGVGCILQVEVI